VGAHRGLAISARSVPRFTKDLDFAIAVANDSEAEDVVRRLRGRGYLPVEVLEQEYVERLSGVRLKHGGPDVIADLLFASSGIESEVAASATRLEVHPHGFHGTCRGSITRTGVGRRRWATAWMISESANECHLTISRTNGQSSLGMSDHSDTL
jgi:hypothetical protein